MRFSAIPLWGLVFFCFLAMPSPSQAGSNLLFNGSFDYTNNPMAGWQYDFTWLGNGLFIGNSSYVSWLEKEGTHKGVAKLSVTDATILHQGVWLDSKLVPYEYPYQYKITVWARTTGPDARIFTCAVMWQSGRTPHPDPDLSETAPKPPNRLIQQGSGHLVYFTGGNNRDMSGPKSTWTKGETIFPDDVPSAEEIKRLKRADFIFVHICGLMGSTGDLFIDDVSIEKLNQKAKVDAPAKAAAKPTPKKLSK